MRIGTIECLLLVGYIAIVNKKKSNRNVMKRMYVYIITNKPNGTLYTGVTNDLVRRMYEHRNKLLKGFSQRYNLSKLVYYECYEDEATAIAREKQMKHFKREWKLELINNFNPEWLDLYESICK